MEMLRGEEESPTSLPELSVEQENAEHNREEKKASGNSVCRSAPRRTDPDVETRWQC